MFGGTACLTVWTPAAPTEAVSIRIFCCGRNGGGYVCFTFRDIVSSTCRRSARLSSNCYLRAASLTAWKPSDFALNPLLCAGRRGGWRKVNWTFKVTTTLTASTTTAPSDVVSNRVARSGRSERARVLCWLAPQYVRGIRRDHIRFWSPCNIQQRPMQTPQGPPH